MREDALELQAVIERSSRWLLAHQDAKTGGWSDLPGKPPSTLNTAEVLLALVDGGVSVVAVGAQPILRAVAFLLEHQVKEGVDQGAWTRTSGGVSTPDLIRTSFAVQALIRTGKGIDDPCIWNAVQWILDVGNPDHGWGPRRQSATSLMPTCFALLTLVETCRGGMESCRQPIERGVELLVNTFQNPDGSFGAEDEVVAPHTIYGAMVLQEARRQHLSRFPDRERDALDWLLANPDKAKRLVEEDVPIGEGAYGFLYMTDSLLLRVLASSLDKRHRASSLAEEALQSVKDKMQPDGGFFGYRTFSWSTAKVVSGLQAAHHQYPRFPTRKPEYAGLRVGHFLLGFAILLGIGMVFLSARGQFGVLQTFFFTFVLLVLLVAYGKIGQETFKGLTERLLDKLSWGRSSDSGTRTDKEPQ